MFDSFFVTLLVAGVVLIIVCLIVRDQTQFRLSRLRSEVLALRSEEKTTCPNDETKLSSWWLKSAMRS